MAGARQLVGLVLGSELGLAPPLGEPALVVLFDRFVLRAGLGEGFPCRPRRPPAFAEGVDRLLHLAAQRLGLGRAPVEKSPTAQEIIDAAGLQPPFPILSVAGPAFVGLQCGASLFEGTLGGGLSREGLGQGALGVLELLGAKLARGLEGIAHAPKDSLRSDALGGPGDGIAYRVLLVMLRHEGRRVSKRGAVDDDGRRGRAP